MEHYKTFKLEKDTKDHLSDLLDKIKGLKFENWFIYTEPTDINLKKYDIFSDKYLSFKSPKFVEKVKGKEDDLFTAILYFGLHENGLAVLTIIDNATMLRLDVNKYNYTMGEFINNVLSKLGPELKGYIGRVDVNPKLGKLHGAPRTFNTNSSIVISADPDKYTVFNNRINRPIAFFSEENPNAKALFQQTRKLQIGKDLSIEYFTPNNIAILISVASKARLEAIKILEEIKKHDKKATGIEIIKTRTEQMCDYIEKIQTSIVFTYTAIEAFVNLSIPEGYEHSKLVKEAGVNYLKVYNRDGVERLFTLRDKIKTILPVIYSTKDIKDEKFYGRFSQLETLRNKIIHQKSIEHTDLYQDYFRDSMFDICLIAEELITFFYDNCKDDYSTNPIWPFIKGIEGVLPRRTFISNEVEIVGNIHVEK